MIEVRAVIEINEDIGITRQLVLKGLDKYMKHVAYPKGLAISKTKITGFLSALYGVEEKEITYNKQISWGD